MADDNSQAACPSGGEPQVLEHETPPPNGKRKAESELDSVVDDEFDEETGINNPGELQCGDSGVADGSGVPVSKNQMKRLKRQQAYEKYKEDRKGKRKDKRHERQARKRAEREAKIAAAEAAGLDPKTALQPAEPWRPRPVPIALVIDCNFEDYMREPEIVSLASQIVRSYSQNRRAKFQTHLLVSSWKGKLKTRFETVLKNSHHQWKGVHVVEGDFLEAATKAHELMAGPGGGEVLDLIKPSQEGNKPAIAHGDEPDSSVPNPEPESDDVDRSVVYLSSESPYTLERLEANTTYVIGGLVDRNREKGLCYNQAKQRNVRTAKLPIGHFMAMQSRYVLTTNQVVEIMVKWLECGDWGEAFVSIIPKRKGGTLKAPASAADIKETYGEGGQEDEEGRNTNATETPKEGASLATQETQV
ncbi:guanine-1-methyltransferase-domain-containing protein [Podospora didyma]|uniref:tRNA (guanine(9)-N1)-methyltransferase n=1 Tax=Podospora didyma TaxID=330526 RepID=A0AAE0NP95_9PEZI|nr:guanine-1-methyltransferase-domain-containing protein [Podospora didyma]